MPASLNDQVLVLRFWQERTAENVGPPYEWRARVSHVNTGQRFYAASIEAAFALVRSLLQSVPDQEEG